MSDDTIKVSNLDTGPNTPGETVWADWQHRHDSRERAGLKSAMSNTCRKPVTLSTPPWEQAHADHDQD